MKQRHSHFRSAKQSLTKPVASPSSSPVDRLLQQAMAHHRVGQLLEAEPLYRQILEVSPEHTDALHLLGVIALQVGQHAMAVELIGKAIHVKPDFADAYINFGLALHGLQRYEAAVQSFEKAIALRPGSVEAHSNRGNSLFVLRRYQLAVGSYDTALSLKPDQAEVCSNRGSALSALGQYQLAVESYDKAISLEPKFADACSQRGNALQRLRQFEAAIKSYDQALLLKPDSAETYSNRGSALHALQQFDAAIASCDEAIRIKPDFAEAYRNRGIALQGMQQHLAALESLHTAVLLKPDFAEAHGSLGDSLLHLHQYQAAVESYDQAILLKPDFAEAYANRGGALHGLRQYGAAAVSCDRAILLNPDLAEAHNNRGAALHGLKEYRAAVESYDRAILLKPNFAYLRGMRLHTKRSFCDWEDSEHECELVEAAIGRDEKVAHPFMMLAMSGSPAVQRKAAEIFVRDKYPQRSDMTMIPRRARRDRIRIGFFSADFRNHPICYLMAESFERHDRSRFELVAFSFGPDDKDEMRARVAAAMDQFLDVQSLSDRELAQLSRELEVDIAVDLMGFTDSSRPGIFAERAAPVQVSYLGYVGTMGAGFMDYLIADHTLVPETSRQYYSEKIAYMPHSFQANDTRQVASTKLTTRAEQGLPEQGFVYCCFNNNSKITPAVFAIWMRILERVPGSVLWLLQANPWTAENLRKEAERRGVSPDRLIFAERVPLAEHLGRQTLADLFLDTFPFNAGATASPALWAGLPILTCMGEAFASRMGASLLRAIDLPELITTSEADYEAAAIDLGLDAERYREIRMSLQRNRDATPLFDMAGFTRDIETLYTGMYERYQAGKLPDHIESSTRH